MVDSASATLYAADRVNIGIPAFAVRYFMSTLRRLRDRGVPAVTRVPD